MTMTATTTRCACCGGENLRPWLTVPWRGYAFDLVWCDDCDLGRIDPVPDPELLASAYDDADYYTHHVGRKRERKHSLARRMLMRLAHARDPLRVFRDHVMELLPDSPIVLDVGPGNGSLMNQITERGGLVVGVEPDPVAAEVARSRGLEVFDGTAEDMPDAVGVERFDVVTMSHVLEHCPDTVAALDNVRRALKPGGTFICEVPNNACTAARLAGATWRWLDVPRHVNFFTPRSLAATLEQAGLEPMAVEFSGYERMFSPQWLSFEQRNWRRCCEDGRANGQPSRAPGLMQYAALLLRTACATPERKFDSVRIVARAH